MGNSQRYKTLPLAMILKIISDRSLFPPVALAAGGINIFMTGDIVMTINYQRIAEKIRKIRTIKKLTQADLAELTGFAVSHISHLETGRKRTSLDALIRIANALGVTVDQLLEGNQLWDRWEYKTELFDLLADCNQYERAILFSCAVDTKRRLREHADLFQRG